MSGAGLEELDRPADGNNPTALKTFPSKKCCVRRDLKASKALTQASESSDLTVDHRQLRELAYRLAYADRREEPPASRASFAHYGTLQMKVGGAICTLIDDTQREEHEVSFVTLCPRGGDIAPDELLAVDPRQWAHQLNSALDRIVRSKALGGRGWSILFLDCEYEESEGIFRFHWHGFASGSELVAIDGLRNLRKYRSPRLSDENNRDPVRFRVRMTRKRLEDLTYLCVYPIKREWKSRRVPSNQPGNRDRTWSKPLPRQFFALERLFFDRWSMQDIAVVRGLRVVKGRLKPTRY